MRVLSFARQRAAALGVLCTGVVWSFKVATTGRASGVRVETKIPSLVSFGADSAGNLYAVRLLGDVSELRP